MMERKENARHRTIALSLTVFFFASTGTNFSMAASDAPAIETKKMLHCAVDIARDVSFVLNSILLFSLRETLQNPRLCVLGVSPA